MLEEKKLVRNILTISLASLTILLKIDSMLAFNQAIRLCTALLIIFAISKIFCETWIAAAEIIYFGSIVLLAINLLGMGTIKRWASIGGIFVQFSEFAKIAMLLMLSKFLATHQLTFFNLLKALTIVCVPALLIFKQPNLGTALIFLATGLGLIWVKGINRKLLISSFIAVIISLPILWSRMLPYQKARITAFIDKSADPRGSSYQTIQSIIAIGSGGLFGSDALQNKLGFVPENHTDFLFSYFAENYGFILTAWLVLVMAFSLSNILNLSYRMIDERKRLFCIGFFLLWFVQSFMNIGMNIGILPVTGVALPFFSYGGSALLAFSTGIGIVYTFAKYNHSIK